MNSLPTNSQLAAGRVTIALTSSAQPALTQRAARSVFAQTYPDIELILSVEFSSSEDVDHCIEALRNEAPDTVQLRTIHQYEPLDPAATCDACLNVATGEFFLMLSDDSTLHRDAIARLVSAFQNPHAPASPADISLAWCPTSLLRSNGALAWATRPGPALETPADMLIALWHGDRGPRRSGILLRTADALEAGGFQSRFGDLSDSALWSLAALSRPYVACVPTPLVQSTRPTKTQIASIPQPTIKARKAQANAIHDALLIRCYDLHLHAARKQLSIHRNDHLFAAILPLLIQRKARPGWLRSNLEDLLVHHTILLRPLLLRRLFLDGRKLLRP